MAVFDCTCGARYRFPDKLIGRPSKCTACGRVIELEDSLAPIPMVADESSLKPAPNAIEQGKIVAPPGSPAATAALAFEQGMVHGAITPTSSYGVDVLWTFLFLASPSNLIVFLAIWSVLFLVQWAASVALILIVLQLLFFMWYAAFRIATIESAAAGDHDLPTVSMGTDLSEDLVQPFGRWIMSWVFVMAPAGTFLVVSLVQQRITIDDVIKLLSAGALGLVQTGGTPLFPFSVLVAVGLFFWPIVLMCVALGGIDTLTRFDLMVVSIVRSLPAYSLMLLLMAGAIALNYLVRSGFTQLIPSAGGVAVAPGPLPSVLPLFLGAGFGLYLDIVLMRLIGLYYHHHKDKLAWWWG